MSGTIEDMIKSLIDGGLMTADDVASFNASLSDRERPISPDSYARELVRQRKVTKLQAAAAVKGKMETLRFGHYQLIDKVGTGAMGQVFKAYDKAEKQMVAVKVLTSKAVKSKKMIKRFVQEAQASAKLNHPNICRTIGAGKLDRVRYMVMEFIEGRTLLKLVKKTKRVPPEMVADYMLQAARGLHHAHEHSIIHRDVKPSNLMLDNRGVVKILDLGLARIEEEFAEDEDSEVGRLTQPGAMIGTAKFMSPEQVEDSRFVDERSDIYSLGCTMYMLVTGKAMYGGGALAQTLLAHCNDPVPSLREVVPKVSEELDLTFQKMVAKGPKDRHQTMRELVDDLRICLGIRKGLVSALQPQPTGVGTDFAMAFGEESSESVLAESNESDMIPFGTDGSSIESQDQTECRMSDILKLEDAFDEGSDDVPESRNDFDVESDDTSEQSEPSEPAVINDEPAYAEEPSQDVDPAGETAHASKQLELDTQEHPSVDNFEDDEEDLEAAANQAMKELDLTDGAEGDFQWSSWQGIAVISAIVIAGIGGVTVLAMAILGG
ncbi:MAG: hypothetical protein CMJ78_03105 [Planctomycetaceae bacterium]|nr:hypothetical protein [Planctomycetaceae bacterium]